MPSMLPHFEALDALRRSQGLLSDGLGSGPRESRHRVLPLVPGAVLRDYGSRGSGEGAPVLIVPAPFKRPYIWDLIPRVSVVRRLQEAGARVFLLDWQTPGRGDSERGLADFALHLPEAAAAAIAAATGQARLALAGHSLGGTFAALFAALRPDTVARLALLDAPLAFGPEDGGPLARAIAAGPHAGRTAEAFGATVPGSAINLFSARAAPEAFARQPVADALACAGRPERLAVHLRVRRWTLDEFPMPARLFVEIAELLYREDRFRRGTLALDGENARLDRLAAPLLALVNPAGLIVPPRSMLAGLRVAPAERRVLRYRAEPGPLLQHLGPLVGPEAHSRIWPAIASWLADAPAEIRRRGRFARPSRRPGRDAAAGGR